MTFLIVMAVSLLVRRASHADSAACSRRPGSLGGLAAATKYNGVFLVAPLLVSQRIFTSSIRPAGRVAALLDARAVSGSASRSLAGAGLGVPFVMADASGSGPRWASCARSMQFGQGDIERPRTAGCTTSTYSLRYGIGLPLLLAGIAGASCSLVRQTDHGCILLFAFPVAYFVVGGQLRSPVLPLHDSDRVRFCVVGGGVACDRRRPARHALRAAALALVATLIVLPSAASVVAVRSDRQRDRQSRDRRGWFADNVPPGSRCSRAARSTAMLSSTADLGDRVDVGPLPQGVSWCQGRRAEGRPDWILVQESPLPSMTQDVVTAISQGGLSRRRGQFKALFT